MKHISKNRSYSNLMYMYSLTLPIPETHKGLRNRAGSYRGLGTRVKNIQRVRKGLRLNSFYYFGNTSIILKSRIIKWLI